LSQFEHVRDNLSMLTQHVSSFMDWWSDMDISLMNPEEMLHHVKVDLHNQSCTIIIKERWMRIHKDYVSYKRQVGHCHYICGNKLTMSTLTDGPSGRLLQELV
jgi:hypothetical protein